MEGQQVFCSFWSKGSNAYEKPSYLFSLTIQLQNIFCCDDTHFLNQSIPEVLSNHIFHGYLVAYDFPTDITLKVGTHLPLFFLFKLPQIFYLFPSRDLFAKPKCSCKGQRQESGWTKQAYFKFWRQRKQTHSFSACRDVECIVSPCSRTGDYF